METLIVGTLATARLTRLVTEDSITQPLRDRAMSSNPLVGELVHCRKCVSVWAAAAVVVASRVSPPLTRMLALSEGAILIKEFVDGR